ncbi:MAG: UDP-N-acetylglucosamine 2-epimerase (non-hydrolyzing) [Planctomycetes bacterium]|nr:UDP-N-acetylglucosamine 2-epimerase (non-hydrolyzing) [Planctomycetota bacterium]
MKLLTVVGARPQFIKAAALSQAIAEYNQKHPSSEIREEILHTGQHFDDAMSRVFFEEMGIPEPAVNLNLGGGAHGQMTGRMLEAIERELIARAPDCVLVYGDTNSTLAGALAASKLHIPLAHVEAGLRSFNRMMPEETNRVLTDHMADLLFCPTDSAVENLSREGISAGVHMVGDVMQDAAFIFRDRAKMPEVDGQFVLATIHRAENTDDCDRLRAIFDALKTCSLPVVMPLHPRTKQALSKISYKMDSDSAVWFVPPASYLEILGYLSACSFVVTDSGGLQKEAFFFAKKCLTLRHETEWIELVDAGWNRLVEPIDLQSQWEWAIQEKEARPLLYGDGTSGQQIAELLANIN